MSGLIEIRRYGTRQEADVAASLLQSCGIIAHVFTDNEGQMAPHLSLIVGVRLLVDAEDRATALKILASDPHGDWEGAVMERLHADDNGNADLRRAVRQIYFAAVFGALVLPIISQIYALWRALAVGSRWAEMDSRLRLQYAFSILFSLLVLSAAAFMVLRLVT